MNNIKRIHEEVLMEINQNYLCSIDQTTNLELYKKSDVLSENIASDVVDILGLRPKDVIKDIVEIAGGAALEGLTGMPADTLVNILAAIDTAEEVIEAVDQLTSENETVKEISDLLKRIDISNGPDVIYDSVLMLLKKISDTGLGDAALADLQPVIMSVLKRISRFMGKAINTIVPYDPGISGAVFQRILTAAVVVGDGYVFDMTKKAYDQLPEEALSSLNSREDSIVYFNNLVNDLESFLVELRESMDEPSFLSRASNFATDLMLAVPTMGTSFIVNPYTRKLIEQGKKVVIDEAIKFIQETLRPNIDVAVDAIRFVLTLVFGFTAAMQIVATRQYKESFTNKLALVDEPAAAAEIDTTTIDMAPEDLEALTNALVAEWTQRHKRLI
jgi:hypothetical protein